MCHKSEEVASKTTVVSEQVQTEKSVSGKIQDTDNQTDEMPATDDDIVTVVTDKTTDGSEAGQYADGNSDSADGNTEEPDLAADQRKADILSEKYQIITLVKQHLLSIMESVMCRPQKHRLVLYHKRLEKLIYLISYSRSQSKSFKVSMTSDETSMEMRPLILKILERSM